MTWFPTHVGGIHNPLPCDTKQICLQLFELFQLCFHQASMIRYQSPEGSLNDAKTESVTHEETENVP